MANYCKEHEWVAKTTKGIILIECKHCRMEVAVYPNHISVTDITTKGYYLNHTKFEDMLKVGE